MKDTIHYVGLDVHKDSIAIGVAEEGGGDPEVLATIPNDPPGRSANSIPTGRNHRNHREFSMALTTSWTFRWLRQPATLLARLPRRSGVDQRPSPAFQLSQIVVEISRSIASPTRDSLSATSLWLSGS